MSCILYYSNYCEPSKKVLQTITKTQNAKDIHFICIDKRVKDANGKVFIILQTGQQIILPENVTRVPALLLLNQNYKVIYGDDIYKHLKPQTQQQVQQATKNNMEPNNFQDGFGSFGGFGGGIVSDNFSFLDLLKPLIIMINDLIYYFGVAKNTQIAFLLFFLILLMKFK